MATKVDIRTGVDDQPDVTEDQYVSRTRGTLDEAIKAAQEGAKLVSEGKPAAQPVGDGLDNEMVSETKAKRRIF
jgi:hypothetical protein